MSYTIIGENIIIKKILIIWLFLFIGCFSSNQKTSEPKIDKFNPLDFIDYSFIRIGDNSNKLKVFYSIDGSQFMYRKYLENSIDQSDYKYIANVEVVFQVLSKKDNIEIDRKVIEVDFIKDNYYDIRNKNIYQNKIEFDLEDGMYLINIKVLDLKTRNTWLDSLEVIRESQELLSNLHFYNIDNDGRELHIYEMVDKDIDKFYCRFQYFNSRDIEKLNLYLIKLEDTIYKQDILVKPNYNEYDVSIKVPDSISGSLTCHVTDMIDLRTKRIVIDNKKVSNFWSYDSNMIRTIMRYVMPNDIYKKIKKMEDKELIFFLKQYWQKLDPDSSTNENELIDELNFRIKYTKTHFKELKTDGWKTDRGRIYIVYGQPKSISTEQNPQTFVKRETWVYPSGDVFVFEDSSFGRYYLINGIF